MAFGALPPPFQSTPARFNLKAMMSCAVPGAMTEPLPVVCPRCSWVNRCSSSARANLAKCLLYAINGGRDEVSGDQVSPPMGAVEGECLEFEDVVEKYERMMDWLANVYVNAMNIIHYMHDKYAYE